MLPQRPSGAPPPRPVGRPPGSPPPSGKPPGPPPGPPPGSPVLAAPAKPPPRGPPPAALPTQVPSSPPSGPPAKAEAKALASAPATQPKKAPPPPRVSSPVSPPLPEDDEKKTGASGRSAPKAPPGQPPKGPARAMPPGASSPPRSAPSTPARPPPGAPPEALRGDPSAPARPSPGIPRGAPPAPARPPPGAPPGAPRGAPSAPARPPPGVPRGAPPAPTRPPPGAPRGALRGAPPASARPPLGAPPGPPQKASEEIAQPPPDISSKDLPPVTNDEKVEADGGETGEGGIGGATPTSAKGPRTPPPSPKAPPGVPAGMVPPKVQILTTRASNSEGINGMEGRAGEEKSATPPGSRSTTLARPNASPLGRRPPPGAPPGRARPTIVPSSARPSPPPVEQLAILASEEKEQMVIAGEQEKDEEVPPPPSLPPPDGLSDGDDDEEDDSSEGHTELVGDEESLISPMDAGRTSKELEVVRQGRFNVRCIEGGDIRKSTLSNKTVTVDVYLKITLGKHKRAPTKKSKVVKRSGVSPDFESEIIAFDVVEPKDFIVGGDVLLSIELWDDSAWSDDLLASVQVSALRFMHPDAVPTAEWFPLEAPSGRIKDRMKVQAEISFEPALVGMFVLTLYEGKGLGANDPSARPSPYVVATLGEMYQKRSRVAKDGGSSPFFKEEEIILWVDRENWTSNLNIQVRSEDLGTDTDLGAAEISILQAMAGPPDQAMEKKVELSLEGQPSGQLFTKSAFLPAGILTIVCEAGRGLRETSAAGTMDPYVVFKADGQAVVLSRKTKVDKDGGQDPRWGEIMKMDIADQYTLWVECYNHDIMGTEELIGSAQCSLLQAFKRGTMDVWIQLTTSSGPGPPKAAGEIHCVFTFVGPLGVAYPQHQPGVDSFDHSLRMNLKGYLEETNEEEQGTKEAEDEESEGVDEEVGFQEREPLQRSTEFTDEEISAAFKFLDLDHNMHIGAAEIRHILICMGELVTDEEIDMMVSMVDTDGDGQVSFEEFHRLVIDPDPSRVDFGTEPTKSEPKEAAVITQEMKDRESKRWLLEEFVRENEIRSVELELAYKQFRNLAPSTGGAQSMEMDFNTWILVFNVEATGQYRKLFKLYDITGTGGGTSLDKQTEKVDIREFFLGMANFVEWSLELRTQFIFTLFDEDRSGFLSMDELVAVLKANHLSTAKAVAKKAQTIMQQADADGSGTLTLDEFLVVAKKFPNLLFPAKKKPDVMPSTKLPVLGNGG